MKLLLLNNTAGMIVRYDNRTAGERFEITNRKEFDATFDRDTAERLRLGTHSEYAEEQQA